ncbi:MAG: hypothetical protein A3K19_29790 [Lentisphaerae bacterium RIFOXYB12_FULL_65_16]|nr:MAG: hypothetical protein A3K18_33400 [Lentisphaerae bacterium RIFOXYA12_64_32]OGV86521.1 MAG: hypothetical protein A3K19_29790 [Lentisphaerae bacterium RIFOXYB12_FULL_65_16]
MREIISNGSTTAGQAPASVETLLELMGREPLDATFEGYGNFVERDPTGTVLFFGNFARRSHVFNILTDEPELIATLTAAIRNNQAGEAYRDARAVYQPCVRCGKLAMFCRCPREKGARHAPDPR